MTASEAFPGALRALCDPDLLFPFLFEPDETVKAATLLRGFWLESRPIILAVRASRAKIGEGEATALAIPGPLFEERGASLVAALPALLDQAEKSLGAADLAAVVSTLKPEGRPKFKASAEATAARLLSALAETSAETGPPALVEGVEEAAFWRSVGAFIHLLPAGSRPGASALYAADTASQRPGAVLLRAASSAPKPAPGAAKVAAEIFAALNIGALTPPRFAPEGAAALQGGLEAALVARLSATLAVAESAAAMRAYAAAVEAAPPAPSSEAEAVQAAGAAAEALRAGAVDGEALTPFGAARCLGWLAGRPDAARFWPALEGRDPSLAAWRALSLAEPAESGPILSLGALAQLDWAEAAAREAAPEGVETPFDAPVLAERRAAAMAAAPDLLIEDPLALTDPALRLERLAGALSGLDPKILARPIDALELAAALPARDCPRAALQELASAARTLRKRSGLSAIGRFDRPPVPAEHAQAALFFGASWLHCLGAGAWSGAAFWRDRFLAWFERSRVENADAVEDALTGLRRFADRIGPAGAYVLAEMSDDAAPPRPKPEPEPEPERATPRALQKPQSPPKPQEPRAHLSPNALQEAMAALRKGAEDDGERPEGVATAREPSPAPRQGRRGAPQIDERALEAARSLIDEFREDYAAEISRRAGGGDPQPLELAYGDKKSFAGAIDAAAALALDSPRAAAEAFGDRIAWALRHLAGLGRKPAARPALEPAPDTARRVWGALGATLQNPTEDADFLCFATKLLAAEKARRLGPNLATDGLVGALQGASVTRMIGADSISFTKTTLRDYLYQGRKNELKGGFEALEDLDVAKRMDRALFFLCLLRCADEESSEGTRRLIDPRRISTDGPEIRGLAPSDVAVLRFGAYLAEGRAPSEAHAAAFETLMQAHGLVHSTALAQLWRRVPRRG